MHRVFCIIGRTASGKSSITNKVAHVLNMKILKSYTTRAMRNEDDTDHIFIKQSEVEQYKSDMVAYTERIGYCSFATSEQLLENDFYIINPQGYYDLVKCVKERNLSICLIPIYVECDINKLKDRAINRGDYDSWIENFNKENDEFTRFEKEYDGLKIDNTESIGEAIKELRDIVSIFIGR